MTLTSLLPMGLSAPLLLLTLMPASAEAWYYWYGSYCSVGCIAGAVVGGLCMLAGLIGLIVFLCFLCSAAKKKRVTPNNRGGTAVFVSSSHTPGVAGTAYPMQQQPPPYNQQQQYPPMYPPKMGGDTAYPPPPSYPPPGYQGN